MCRSPRTQPVVSVCYKGRKVFQDNLSCRGLATGKDDDQNCMNYGKRDNHGVEDPRVLLNWNG